MAKQGMKRMERTHTQPRNEVAPVPEIQGKAKHGKVKVRPIIAETSPPSQMVFHSVPVEIEENEEVEDSEDGERPIPDVYPAIDNDLARDNLENDITAADLQDL